MSNAELFLLSLGPIFFIIGFLTGLFAIRTLKKRLRNGEVDWDNVKKVRTRSLIIFFLIGIILSSIGYFSIATDSRVLSIILWTPLNFVLQGFLLLGSTVFGMAFLGAGIGVLVYKIRKPQ